MNKLFKIYLSTGSIDQGWGRKGRVGVKLAVSLSQTLKSGCLGEVGDKNEVSQRDAISVGKYHGVRLITLKINHPLDEEHNVHKSK